MIKSLSITNIALIDKLEVEFGDKLNVLSGETGAGKSIIIDSVGFVLGDRADKSLIRYGTDYAVVEAVFENYETANVNDYLEENGIDRKEILILRRKMTVDGKNECRINGRISTLATLRGLTDLLVDIHGQHEHQSLLNSSTHLGLLDSLGGDEVENAKLQVKELHSNYVNLKRELSSIGNQADRERKLDVLSYQIAEIEKADIKEGEEEELLEKRKRIRNIEKILDALSSAKELLDGYESTAVSSALKTTIATLNLISTYDNRIEGLNERLYDAREEIIDVAETVKDFLNELDFDKYGADEIESRLETVRGIQRKYGGSYLSLTEFYENAKQEYDMLSNSAERVVVLEKEIAKTAEKLLSNANKLTAIRTRIAKSFEKNILGELKDLGMGGSTFKVGIASTDNPDEITASGADTVEFLISPNVGEPLKPLAKIISGGEMSRFMLALKNILADVDDIGTMIFDEIDTGISGNISAVVAEKMANVSRKRQVIAVTHMPALASMADSHYLIAKSIENGKTHTHLDLLSEDTDEIARLLGGKDYSTHAVPHALEMKNWANEYKKSIENK